VLEVKQACSGSRSIFALLALAVILGFSIERKWWARIPIGGGGSLVSRRRKYRENRWHCLIAKEWGALAASESLHTTWAFLCL